METETRECKGKDGQGEERAMKGKKKWENKDERDERGKARVEEGDEDNFELKEEGVEKLNLRLLS